MALVAAHCLVAAPALAEKRVALVIGNDRYANLARLFKAGNDAQSVGDTLQKLGFEVVRGRDLSRQGMVDKIAEFTSRIEPGDTAVFFYAGHGVAIGNLNYLVPIDSPAAEVEARVRGASIQEADVVAEMQARGARVSVLILDACRDNPFPKQGTRSVGNTRGLVGTTPARGVFVLYSAGGGQTALDRLERNDPNRNSVFTRVLVEYLPTPNLHLSQLAVEVRERVAEIAKLAKDNSGQPVPHEQTPAYYDQTIGRVFLAGRTAVEEKPPAPVVQQPAADELIWGVLQHTSDVAALRRFAEQFPASVRRRDAEARIAALESETRSRSDAAELARQQQEQRERAAEEARRSREDSERTAAEAARQAQEARERVVSAEAKRRADARQQAEERRAAAIEARKKAQEERERAAAEAARKAQEERERAAAAEAQRSADLQRQAEQREAEKRQREEAQRQADAERRKLALALPPVAPAAPSDTSPRPAVGVFSSAIKVDALTAERERTIKPKETFRECDVCPEMVVVPAGKFMMGNPKSWRLPEGGWYGDGGPRRQVTFARKFAVGKTAVTFDEWDACVADGGCTHKPADEGRGRGNRPVINVSWDDAKGYIDWLSKRTGRTYRLLSEAEREYVTRAGTTSDFWWGSARAKEEGTRTGTVPVDTSPPNPWGVAQVHSNVAEWTEDCRNENYTGAPTDGSAWTKGWCSHRMLRGGWEWSVKSSWDRANDIRDRRYAYYGFRVARSVPAEPVAGFVPPSRVAPRSEEASAPKPVEPPASTGILSSLWSSLGSRSGPAPDPERWKGWTLKLEKETPGGARRADFSADGLGIISYRGNDIDLWDVQTGALQKQLSTAGTKLASVIPVKYGRALTSSRDEIVVWDPAASNEPLRTIKLKENEENSEVLLSPDGKRIVSAGGDLDYWAIMTWDADTGRRLSRTLTGKTEFFPRTEVPLFFFPDSKRFVTKESGEDFRVRDATSGKVVRRIAVPKESGNRVGVSVVRLSPDGKLLAVGGEKGEVHILDLGRGRILHRVDVGYNNSTISALAFSPDGRQLLVGSAPLRGLKVVDMTTGRVSRNMEGGWLKSLAGVEAVGSIAFSPDGKRFLTTSGGFLGIWDFEKGIQLRAIHRVIGWSDRETRVSLAADNSFSATPDLLGAFVLTQGDRKVPLPDDYKAAFMRDRSLDEIAAALK